MEGKRENDPMLVRWEDVRELRRLMRDRFTIGTHDACRALQCSRSWFERNVKPSLHYVFATPAALRALKPVTDSRGLCADQCWYDGGELRAFVRAHAAVEQRTKRVHLAALVDDPAAAQAELEAKGLTDSAIARELRFAVMTRLMAAQEDVIVAHAGELGRELADGALSPATGRAAAPWEPYPRPEEAFALFGPLGEWRTVADMLDYGDVREAVYRRLFASGALRCTIELPGGARHVMYCPDPHPAPEPDAALDAGAMTVAVPVALWDRRPERLR